MPELDENLLPRWPWWLGRHPLLALTAALVVWGLVDVRARGRIDPENLVEHRTDFTVYTEAGAAFFDGRDPYAVTNARGWGYLYPPLFAILIAPLAVLGPQWQVTIWFFISLLLLWGCYRETTLLLAWLAGRRRPDGPAGETGSPRRLPEWLPRAAAIAALLPTLNCLQRGQVGILQLYLLVLGFRWLATGSRSIAWRSAGAGLIFALAVVIKVTPALPVGLLLVERLAAASGGATAARRQIIGCSLGLSVGLVLWLLVVPAATIGWQRNIDCLARWGQLIPTKAVDIGHDLSTGDAYSVRNQSLVNAARHLGNWIAAKIFAGPDSLQPIGAGGRERVMERRWVDGLLLAVRLAVVGLLALAAALVGRRRDPLASAAMFGVGLAATLVVSPVARTHYFLLLAPAVLLTAWHLYRQGHSRLAWWLAWTPTVLVVPHYFVPLAAGRVGWLGLGITAWLVAGTIALVATGQPALPNRRVASLRALSQASRLGLGALPVIDQVASCRASAASCVVGGFDPSES